LVQLPFRLIPEIFLKNNFKKRMMKGIIFDFKVFKKIVNFLELFLRVF